MNLSWIGRGGKHRADSPSARLRAENKALRAENKALRAENRRLLEQLVGAAFTVNGFAKVRSARAEAEELVVALRADLDERTEQRDAATSRAERLQAENNRLRAAGSDDTQPLRVAALRDQTGHRAA